MLLTSCASPVRESEQMIRQGQVNEGLAKLEEAVRNAPGNTGYQAALYRNREAAINEKLVRADTLAGKRNFDEAETVYNDVLTMHAGSPRATAGVIRHPRDRRTPAEHGAGAAAGDQRHTVMGGWRSTAVGRDRARKA